VDLALGLDSYPTTLTCLRPRCREKPARRARRHPSRTEDKVGGWIPSGVPPREPWELVTAAFKFDLYAIKNVWTQFTDVAAQRSEKVAELHDLAT
jgi:hypothetical protein